jgi:hypothetical protein
VALAAVPVRLAVTVFALKFPEASRATIVLAPLELEAVVLAFARVPELILDALIEVSADPLAVMTFAVKFPDASLDTMVFAPFDDEAVVLAFASVPLEIFDALMELTFAPEPFNVPMKFVAETLRPVKSPDPSRETMVLAPLALEAVVRSLDKVPVLITLAFIAVTLRFTSPDPLKDTLAAVAPPEIWKLRAF